MCVCVCTHTYIYLPCLRPRPSHSHPCTTTTTTLRIAVPFQLFPAVATTSASLTGTRGAAVSMPRPPSWPLHDIVLLRGFCARINHPFIAVGRTIMILCTSIVQYTTPPRPPRVCIPYTIQYYRWQYRVKTNLHRHHLCPTAILRAAVSLRLIWPGLRHNYPCPTATLSTAISTRRAAVPFQLLPPSPLPLPHSYTLFRSPV